MRSKRMAVRSYCAAVALVLALLPLTATSFAAADAPGQAKQAAAGAWVGQLHGDPAFVAIVYDGAQLAAYVCDDGRLGTWFFASPGAGARFELAGAGGALLVVTLGAVADGQFIKDGQTYKFEAHKTNREVLFRADAAPNDTPVVAGWIKNGGQTRGTVAIGSNLTPAPTLATTVKVTIAPGVLASLSPAAMTPDTLAQPTANTTKFVWGAVGDSYASGEGNPEAGIADRTKVEDFTGLRWGNDTSIFVPNGSASLAADVTTCHRSDQAAAPKAQRTLQALYGGMTIRLGFVACGGAKTTNLTGPYSGPGTSTASLLGHDRVTQPAQLDRIADFADDQGQLDALYMSIGGNNAGFGDIITDCISPVGPANCADKWDTILDARLFNLIKPGGDYAQVNNRIVTLFGPQLPVLIQEYPNPLHNGSTFIPPACFGPDYDDAPAEVGFGGYDDALQDNITHDEANWAFGVSARLDSAVESAANTFGWTTIDGHLSAFNGHGVCTDQPFVNLNSAALRRQGRDIPDTSFFLFSSGFMHPNDAGYSRMATATTDRLRPLVDNIARGGLAAPVNVRVASATRTGPLTLRWNDRATSENAYEVLVLPVRAEDAADLVVPTGAVRVGAGYRIRLSGAARQEYAVDLAGGGQFSFQVRACQTGIQFIEGLGPEFQCGAWSARIIGTNVDPARPTGVNLTHKSLFLNGKLLLIDSLTWSPQVDAIEFVVRVEATDGSATETRTTGTSYAEFSPPLGALYKVAACNRVGCSFYVSP
jgi:hypothetical protein